MRKIKIKLQEVLTEKKTSQNKLADILGVSPSTVNELCKGEIKRVNIETLAKVADHFKIDDIRELFEIVEDEESVK
ncbi:MULTISPECIES: helix-turn-helix domain-containing protein [Bacillus cereus group]|uniref:helix-turn-helix domain-containing protein n=1 Tax=Bacillus cereus group TaxID=86661 RepID=UPI000BF70F35|nr:MULTISPECIES: helix-turn-helix transcriptional regulator [Bacillus cereus group]PEU03188.1 transcriptional regulator [Bacillus cereus]PEZ62090.1 transcriptional regulator [Bacillus cereus]PFB67158.1 transcriptional regulator [Bacillus cereus]